MAERKTKEIAGENGKVSGVADSDREGKGNAGTGTAGAETGGKTGAEEARQGVPKLAVVEVPGDEKPKEKKKTDTKKKKQTKEQRKAAELKELAGNLSVLIKTGFDMAAMRLGDVWEVTEEECKKIADPLARILNRYGVLEKAAEYSDFAALVMATGSVVIPRYLIYMEMKKVDQARKVKPAVRRSNEENNPVPAAGGNVKELVPGLSM